MTQKVIVASGSTTATATLTDPWAAGAGPSEIIVLDWLLASGTTAGAAADALVAVAGNNVARKTVAASSSDFIFLDFSGGYPCWSASDADAVVATGVTVALTGFTTNSQVVVGYHYGRPSRVRD